ncbi:MAG TPA: hypothetical protein VFQ39_08900 [Longimicrobium sp.]|nr:hypothetical protein [Longimicrobium sp.]
MRAPAAGPALVLLLCACGTTRITDLGTLGGPSVATDVNARGEVVGYSRDAASLDRPFLWRAGTIREIPTTGGPSSVDHALAINDGGQVTGRMGAPGTYAHAFLWEGIGVARDLDTGESASIGHGVNEDGVVAGEWASPRGGGPRASVWEKGRRRELRTVAGDRSIGYAIGKHGQVVGMSSTGEAVDAPFHAILWWGETVRDLGTLGGRNSTAQAITFGRWPDAGDETTYIVGWANTAAGDEHAFVWNRGRMRDLGTLPGHVRSGAYDVNSARLVVGYSADRAGETRAVMWPGGIPVDLNTLVPSDSGWVLEVAYAVNDRGQIVGQGRLRGQTRAFLLELR